MRSLIATAIFALTAGGLAAVPAYAQTTSVQIDVVGPHNPYCGSWQNNTWVPNGNCVNEAAPSGTTTTTTVTHGTTTTVNPPASTSTTVVTPVAPAQQQAADNGRVWQTLHGTIIGVNGHLVTIQQSSRTLVINDSPALNRDDSGRVAVGRQVQMHGYWEGGVYYATRME